MSLTSEALAMKTCSALELSSLTQLLDEDEEQAPQLGVLGLEQLRRGEEDVRGLGRGERVAGAEQVQDVGHAAHARADADRDRVEGDLALLQHGALVNALEGQRLVVHLLRDVAAGHGERAVLLVLVDNGHFLVLSLCVRVRLAGGFSYRRRVGTKNQQRKQLTIGQERARVK
jgi:hypothetical protein